MIYTSVRKEHWRNWVWNQIGKKLKASRIRKKDALILYLVGPDDKDRETALKKEFYNYNLIAVDMNEEYVKNVRQKSNLAIQGNICDILAFWPEDWPIAAIIADFTCGLDLKTALMFQTSLILSRGVQYGDTIVAANFQRGRDPESNPIRTFAKEAKSLYQENKDFVYDVISDHLHRGKQFIMTMMNHGIKSIENTPSEIVMKGKYVDIFIEQVEPVFHSYRQTDVQPYMDSVIFKMPFGHRIEKYDSLKKIYMEMRDRHIEVDDTQVRNRIAALRAVRTMKMRNK